MRIESRMERRLSTLLDIGTWATSFSFSKLVNLGGKTWRSVLTTASLYLFFRTSGDLQVMSALVVQLPCVPVQKRLDTIWPLPLFCLLLHILRTARNLYWDLGLGPRLGFKQDDSKRIPRSKQLLQYVWMTFFLGSCRECCLLSR